MEFLNFTSCFQTNLWATIKISINFFEQYDVYDLDSLRFHNLGIRYEQGKEVEQNYAKEIEYYEKAAQLGYHDALFNLAILYKDGNGVEQNYIFFFSQIFFPKYDRRILQPFIQNCLFN